jgi:hypothetical protein
MKMKSILCLTFLALLALTSCGRKGALDYPGGQKRPKFDRVVDEDMGTKNFDKLAPCKEGDKCNKDLDAQ